MEAKDLMIGNYVDWKINKSLKIEMIDGQCGVGGLEGVELCPISDWQPIPLTEEWLVKFGFVSVIMEGYPVYFYKCLSIEFYALESNIHFDTTEIKCKHVHSLQNLYFALTGEELEIE